MKEERDDHDSMETRLDDVNSMIPTSHTQSATVWDLTAFPTQPSQPSKSFMGFLGSIRSAVSGMFAVPFLEPWRIGGEGSFHTCFTFGATTLSTMGDGEAIELLLNGTVSLQTERPSISGQINVKCTKVTPSSSNLTPHVVMMSFDVDPMGCKVSCIRPVNPPVGNSAKVDTSDCDNIEDQWASVTNSLARAILTLEESVPFLTGSENLTADGVQTLSTKLFETIEATYGKGMQMIEEYEMKGIKVALQCRSE